MFSCNARTRSARMKTRATSMLRVLVSCPRSVRLRKDISWRPNELSRRAQINHIPPIISNWNRLLLFPDLGWEDVERNFSIQLVILIAFAHPAGERALRRRALRISGAEFASRRPSLTSGPGHLIGTTARGHIPASLEPAVLKDTRDGAVWI